MIFALSFNKKVFNQICFHYFFFFWSKVHKQPNRGNSLWLPWLKITIVCRLHMYVIVLNNISTFNTCCSLTRQDESNSNCLSLTSERKNYFDYSTITKKNTGKGYFFSIDPSNSLVFVILFSFFPVCIMGPLLSY